MLTQSKAFTLTGTGDSELVAPHSADQAWDMGVDDCVLTLVQTNVNNKGELEGSTYFLLAAVSVVNHIKKRQLAINATMV
jgi:hypothetical protein